MAENLTRKILRDHLRAGVVEARGDITVAVDQVLLEDATGTMAAMQFEMLSVDSLAVPLAVMYVDHNVLQIDDKNMQDHQYLRTFSARFGLRYSPAGNGISHYIHLERFVQPGQLLVGADSHTSMAGAVGMFAIGAGGLEVAVAMAGYGLDFVSPRVVGVDLTGKLSERVEAKDIVLELLRRHGVRGGRGKVFEFYGDGVVTLSSSERATICNMIVETGAMTAIFPSDEQTRLWLAEHGREEDYRALGADAGSSYDDLEDIDLGSLQPLVALPPSPGSIKLASELEDVRLVQVCVGSSVNSSYDDLATVASILRSQTVHPDVQLTVTPGSKQILREIIDSGVYQDLIEAGARMLEPVCGPCVRIGQAPLKGAASLRTFNRNFPGRSGTTGDQVYLCSPATAAASALAGRITDPRLIGVRKMRERKEINEPIDVLHITEALPKEARERIVIERGPNLVPPPWPKPVPERLKARVLIAAGDDISTGDVAANGVMAMSVWSNIAVCARFMFQRIAPGFHDRAQRWCGGIITAGENYGQGSSRACSPDPPSLGGSSHYRPQLCTYPSPQSDSHWHRPVDSRWRREVRRRGMSGASMASPEQSNQGLTILRQRRRPDSH